MRFFLFFPAFILFLGAAGAQSNFWAEINESNLQGYAQQRVIVPSQYKTLSLDLPKFSALLATAPQEAEVDAGESGLKLAFPSPSGAIQYFEVWEAPVMAPELTAQYPNIRSYAGKNRNGDYIRFDLSPNGLHAMVLTTDRKNSWFVDPYARGTVTEYVTYAKRDFPRPEGKIMECLVEGEAVSEMNGAGAADRAGSCGTRRQYRLALACTGEYANYHGSFNTDKAPALAAMNTSMTRVNGVFETDAGLRMIMVANNANIIYTNPATDPYTNNNGSTMLGQNITTCNNVIGSANYDIGHVFSTGGGGVAYLRSPCTSNKAGGVTGQPNPVGDPFDIDYVAHEMGHQFGGNHTQYNNCQRNSATAMEPGSASSIMGYAGICSPNVQSNSDPYFHAVSVSEMATFVNGSVGNGCAVHVSNGNNAPTCAALTNKTIPISTPFILTASGSDPDSDPITYCWDQMDGYKTPAQTMPPTSTNKSGPVFRSFNPSTSPSRYFPRFSDVWDNITPTWERLPSVARTLNFRVVVRDNHPDGGCNTERNIVLTTVTTAGPFVVTSPNTAVNWLGGSSQTVTWNVAGTTANGVNCANVSISITTDGGATFTTLLASTPNDGSQAVTIPNVSTSQARIMVSAVGNVFYDISNVNFTITGTSPLAPGDGDAKKSGETLHVYPNPTSGLMQVYVPGGWQSDDLKLRIWSPDGRLLIEENGFYSGQTIEVMHLAPGPYRLEVVREKEALQQIFFRQ